MGSRDLPPCPPIVRLTSGGAGHLLAWRKHERTGQWWAWVSWIQETSGGYVHHIVEVRADTITPLEPPQAYREVPRQLLGTDGQNRRWRPGGRLTVITARPVTLHPPTLGSKRPGMLAFRLAGTRQANTPVPPARRHWPGKDRLCSAPEP